MITAFARKLNLATDAEQPRTTDHPVARFRPREMLRLMAIRHGRALPEDETGARFRDRMLDTFAVLGSKGRLQAESFLMFRCRWMTSAERADAIEAAFSARRLWTAEALGNDLDVTEEEHKRARLRTIRVAGMTDAEMKVRRGAKDAARKREMRLQQRLEPRPRASKPARRVDAILNILPNDGWWNVTAVVSQLERSKAIVFGDLDREAGSLRPAVHRAIKHGIKDGRLEARTVPGSKMSEAMQIRRVSPA
jgi:hypothetical protein